MHGRWVLPTNPCSLALIFVFVAKSIPIRYHEKEKKQKKLHGYTSNRFEHTALNLEYFAF